MKSFATSICPIKNPLAVNMMHPRATPAPSQPGKSVFYRMLADSGPFSWTSRCSLGAPVGLRHGDPAQRCLRGIPAWQTIPQPISKRFLSGVITALRHGDPCPQVPQRHPPAILLALSPRYPRIIPAPSPRGETITQPISKRFLFGVITGLRHVDLAQRCLRGISVWRDGLKPVIYLFLSMKLAFFMDIEVLTGCLSMKLAFFMDIEVWIGSLAIKLAFIMADEVRQGGRTVLQARRPTHNYPRGNPGRGNSDRGNPGRGDPDRGDPVRDNPDRGDPGRGGNAHFADNPCLFTGKMVYLRPHNFRAG